MKFKLLSGDDTSCAGGKCPSIYLGDDGEVYIKGKVLTSEVRAQLAPDSDEDVVRLPVEVLRAALPNI